MQERNEAAGAVGIADIGGEEGDNWGGDEGDDTASATSFAIGGFGT